jgi:plasmid replication initiation protein
MERQVIHQHNAITEARYDISSLEKNIIYMLLLAIKASATTIQKNYYRISLKELNQRIGFKIKLEELIAASRSLLSRVYTIIEEDGAELHTSLISSITNITDEELEIGVSSMALPYLIFLQEKYTEFDLDTALGMDSIYSKRMYEMLSQYRKAGEISISLEDLKWRLALIDSKTGIEKYKAWTNFQKAVLETPKKELSQKSDINFTYKTIKTGKKYTHLHFTIIDLKQQLALK